MRHASSSVNCTAKTSPACTPIADAIGNSILSMSIILIILFFMLSKMSFHSNLHLSYVNTSSAKQVRKKRLIRSMDQPLLRLSINE